MTRRSRVESTQLLMTVEYAGEGEGVAVVVAVQVQVQRMRL